MTLITTPQPTLTWQDVAAKKRLVQAEAIAAFTASDCNNSDGIDESSLGAITNEPDAAALVSKISRGEVTSEAVVKAYIRRCGCCCRPRSCAVVSQRVVADCLLVSSGLLQPIVR